MIKKLIAAAIGLFGLVGTARAFDPNSYYVQTIASDTVLVAPTSYYVDTNDQGGGRISFQMVVSSVNVSTFTFYDGLASTATFTISSNSVLGAATSFITLTVTSNTILSPTTGWITITVASNSALAGAQVLFCQQGTTYTFVEGRDWTRNSFSTFTSPAPPDFSSATAVSIANALNFSTYSIVATTGTSYLPTYMSTGTASTVVIRAQMAGSFPNAWTITTSTQFALTVAYSTGSNGNAALPVGISTFNSNCSILQSTPIAFSPGRNGAWFQLVLGTATFRYTAATSTGIPGTFMVDPLVTGTTGTAVNIATAISTSGAAFSVFASTSFALSGTVNAQTPGAAVPQNLSGLDTSVGISSFPNVVVIRTITAGSYGNLFTLQSSSQFAMTVSRSTGDTAFGNPRLGSGTSNFIEGRDAVIVKVSSWSFYFVYGSSVGRDTTLGQPVPIQGTSTGTAAMFSDLITTGSPISNQSIYSSSQPLVLSSWTSSGNFGLVVATQGYVANFSSYAPNSPLTMFTSSMAAVTISSWTIPSLATAPVSYGNFHGGFATQIDTFTNLISSVNAYVNGMAVVLTVPLIVPPGGPGQLLNSTTYFIAARTPQSFGLSRTSTGAFAGVLIPISTQAARGGTTIKLAPLQSQFNGAVNVKIQRSNDRAFWYDVPSTSFTITAQTLSPLSTYYDLGQENARYVRATVDASSNTPTSFRSVINEKR